MKIGPKPHSLPGSQGRQKASPYLLTLSNRVTKITKRILQAFTMGKACFSKKIESHNRSEEKIAKIARTHLSYLRKN